MVVISSTSSGFANSWHKNCYSFHCFSIDYCNYCAAGGGPEPAGADDGGGGPPGAAGPPGGGGPP